MVDDGRLSGGVLAAPTDGEGRPTSALTLVDRGVFRQPLVPWTEARARHLKSSGCMRRASWRDLPNLAPTHLHVVPNGAISARSLLDNVARGFYLLDTMGKGVFDLAADHFELPVCGFALRQGRAVAPVANCMLSGKVSSLLHGIQAVARDLSFEPLQGMLGSPTLLLTGMELRSAG